MNTRAPIQLASLLLFALGACARADTVTDWNSAALNAIRADKTTPPQASRNLAILHAAIYDAVNGITRTHEPYFTGGHVPASASRQAAAAAAGHAVLLALYPNHQTNFAALYSTELAALRNGPQKRMGITWGLRVARVILASRANDGSTNIVPYAPGTNPGDWVPTPPAFAPALLPQWGKVRPFAMDSTASFLPPAPPALTSTQWAFDLNLTQMLGAKTNSLRTADQTEIALFWADGGGTATPPGHWNVIAQEIAAARGNTLEQNARLFALLNISLADAAIVCWDCKYIYNRWRPITAIHEADLDGNPDTTPDLNWAPLIVTPPFPEYTSGHSTFSAAAATVLAGFFGSDNIHFTTGSDALPGVKRTFASFSAAAQEAGISRIYGGIHFMTSNENALACGERLGAFALENFLLDKGNRSRIR